MTTCGLYPKRDSRGFDPHLPGRAKQAATVIVGVYDPHGYERQLVQVRPPLMRTGVMGQEVVRGEEGRVSEEACPAFIWGRVGE